MYLIRIERQDRPESYDYWHNKDGWTEFVECADVYPDDTDVSLPPLLVDADGVEWVKLKEVGDYT